MSYTIELSPDEEKIVHRRASRLGITPQEYVRRSLGRQLQKPPHALALRLTEEERMTLSQLNARLPASFWERYATVTRKIRDRSLTEAEHQEIKALAQREEAWNGDRLQLLQQMAQRRNAPLLRFMKRNGIGPHPDSLSFSSEL